MSCIKVCVYKGEWGVLNQTDNYNLKLELNI